MEEALVARLLAGTAVAALVGARIHWTIAPQGVGQPFVVLTIISGPRGYTMTGPDGLVPTRVQVDCYGLTFALAKTIARAVETRLSGYRGASSGVTFGGIFLDAERDGYEDEATPDKLFRTSLDFIVWHS